ncbi:MAG: hypothetical protein ACKV2V_16935 [Blastocatellia bacterium]
MYKNVLQAIEGVALYPVISLLIFFAFFTGLLVWVWRADRAWARRMAEMPLETEARGAAYNREEQ